MTHPRILECTLRDGSYVINFQFTAEETRQICRALEGVGFDLIEIGHGVGLGASERGKGVAAETDEAYMRAAAESLGRAAWGMFCIPGIAELRHVDLARDHGMKFIRIGTNVEDAAQARPFIERAKRHGMLVCANFMKSYVCAPDEFAAYAQEAERYGADVVYIVDSAGGMFPRDVARYVEAIRARCPALRLGFHGHHNLGLAVANALAALEAGVEIIDTSLQGFGRSAGNTSTEQLICALIRLGVDLDIDPIAVMDIAEKHIQPLLLAPGLRSVDLVAGLALFHSSYMPVIEEFATRYRVDPRKLIIAVCKHDRTNAPRELVEAEARRLAAAGERGQWKPLYQHYYGGEQG